MDDIHAVFGIQADPLEAAIVWGADTLSKGRLSATEKPVAAIREIRRHEPALGLVSATYLVQKIAARGQ